MSSTTPQKATAQAKAILLGFEVAYTRAVEEGVDVVHLGWESFSDRMLAPFVAGSTVRHLAQYALGDAKIFIDRVQAGLPADTPKEERRRLLHVHAEAIAIPPAAITDSGKNTFADYGGPDNVDYAAASGATTERLGWRDFDFDYYWSEHTGCPALDLDPSDQLPVPGAEMPGVRPPANFLVQFFHIAVDVVLNDPAYQATTIN